MNIDTAARKFRVISNAVRIELMQFFGSPIFFAAVAAAVIYCIMGMMYCTAEKDILNMLYCSQPAQIVEIGLFLILGLRLSSKEERCHASEFMSALYRGSIIKAAAKLIALLLLCVMWYAARCAVILIFGLIMGTNPALIVHCFCYLVLTTLFPTAIGGVLGLCTGFRVSSPAKYAVVFFVWAVISPVMSTLNEIIATILNSDSMTLQYIIKMLSLGTPISHERAMVYGFNMELPRWIHVILFLLLTLAYYAVLNAALRRDKILRGKLKTAVLPFGYAACLLAAIALSYNEKTDLFFNYYSYPSTMGYTYETGYWQSYYENENGFNGLNLDENGNLLINREKLPEFDGKISFTPLSWDIDLDTSSMSASVKASLNAVMNKECERQSFTLYRNFNLKSVKINGSNVKFNQKDSWFEVDIPSGIEAGSEVRLDFEYIGMSAPLCPANDYMVCLPANFPWIPVLGLSELSETGGYMSSLEAVQTVRQLDGTSEADYRLKFNSAHEIYTNLTRQSEGVYAGKSNMGVSILTYPTQRVTQIEDQTVYYPLYVEEVLDKIVHQVNLVNKYRNGLLEMLGQPIETTHTSVIAIFPHYVVENDRVPVIDESIDFYMYSAYAKGAYYYDGYDEDLQYNAMSYAEYSVVQCNKNISFAMEYDYINMQLPSYMCFWYCENILQNSALTSKPNADEDIEEMREENERSEQFSEKERYSEQYIELTSAVLHRLEAMTADKENEALQKFFAEWYAKQQTGQYSDIYEIMDMLDIEMEAEQ